MSPELRFAITAQNRSSAVLQQVRKDVEALGATGGRAATGLHAVEEGARLSGAQVAEMGHVMRSFAGTMMAGGSAMQAFGYEANRIVSIFTIGQGGIGGTFKALGGMVGNLLTRFWPLTAALAAAGGAFAGLTYEINKNARTHVSFMDTVKGVWNVVSSVVGNGVRSAISLISGPFDRLVDFITPGIKIAVNAVVGGFVGAFEAVRDTWSLLPAAMGDIVIQATNKMLSGITDMVNGAIDQIDGLIKAANEKLGAIGIKLGTLGHVGGAQIPNPFAGAADKAAGAAGADFKGALGTNYAGKAFDAVSAAAQKAALENDKLGKSLKAANDNGRAFEKMLADLKPLLEDTNDPFAILQSQMDKLGALLNAGQISWAQYGEAVQRANLLAASSVLGSVGQLTGALSQLFEGNKAFAVANAVVNTAEGVTKALAQGGIFGFVGAAAVAASGAAQIAAILSAEPGSASVPSPSGGAAAAATPTPAAAPAAPPAPSVTVQLVGGGRYSRDEVLGLIKDINAALGDGARLNVA